jgi:ergothioneine biosynthesis protein EgtB
MEHGLSPRRHRRCERIRVNTTFATDIGAKPRGALAAEFHRVRQASVQLAAQLSAEDCQVQSMPDASPTKWHLAHITWFFETFILEPHEPHFQPFDASFRVLYNSYYQGIGERHPRPERGFITRPSLSDVLRYRANVDERMMALLSRPMSTPLEALVTLGLHHEQQHEELILTDIKHLLSCNPLHPAYVKRWPMAAVQPQPLRWFGFDEGLFELGHDAGADGAFHFDNEGPRHRVWHDAFEIASRPVTYGEYLDFMNDGGYLRPELWLSMGWDWVQSAHRRAPLYWLERDRAWHNHTLQGVVEIDARTPVCHLSYFEADAYARWAGARLPSESEWERAARSLRAGSAARGNFADRGAFHPLPQSQPTTDEPVQMYGDVWEWTRSSYAPYPGYAPLPGAVGEYNGKFMCNQMVLRGGSCATPAGHVRASYRNFFPPDAQWQFSGLRLARDLR